MNHLQIYEKFFENTKRLNIGDFVICKNEDPLTPKNIREFIENTIGKYIEYNEDDGVDFRYIIKYDKPTKEFIEYENGFEYYCSRNEILYFSKNKKDLELILNSKKYNL